MYPTTRIPAVIHVFLAVGLLMVSTPQVRAAGLSELNPILFLDFENGLTNSGVSGIAAGLDTNPSSVITADAILPWCGPGMARSGNCAIRTKIACSPAYYTGENYRSESQSEHKLETRYNPRDFIRYEFSFKPDTSWPVEPPSNRNSIDTIWQFKRFETTADVFFALKGADLVLRYPNGQQPVLSPYPVGAWVDIRVDIYWSAGADGEVRVSYRLPGSDPNYVALAPVLGPNLLSPAEDSTYLKWGLYKPGFCSNSGHVGKDRLIYHDDIRAVRLSDFGFSGGAANLTRGVNGQIAPSSKRGITISGCTSTPALPEGLALDPSTCVISGTPVYAEALKTYQISATGKEGTVTAPLDLQVEGPPSLYYPPLVAVGLSKPLNPDALGIKSHGTMTCHPNKGLPAGVTLGADCRITGTPTQTAKYDLTITADNAFGSSVATFTFYVEDQPIFTYPNGNVLSFPLNQTTRFTISKTSRFYPESCQIEDQAGNPIQLSDFSINPVSCTLSGWPSKAFAPLEIYVRGTNAGGTSRIKVTLQMSGTNGSFVWR